MATEYKLSYTGAEINEKLEKVDNIVNQILDPDNYPFDVTESDGQVITLEVGLLSISTGGEVNEGTGLRSSYFIPMTESGKIYPVFDEATLGNVCFLFYDSSYNFITEWNEGYNYRWMWSGGSFYAPSNAAYFKCFCSCEATEGSVTISGSEQNNATRAEHKKIYIADHGYSIYGDIIDDETMHKIVIEAEGKDDNVYNVIEIKAPPANPKEATIALMNWGNGNKQFVDFSSMTYVPDNPTVEIVCQARGGMPLPEFSVRYNDGNGAGRVKKFAVNPDAIPIHLTADGLKVRRNNNYNNDLNSDEYVTINLAELADTVESLSSGGEIVKSYITDEARRVSDIAHENRTADSFVFAALSDCHYGQNDETQISIEHTAQALCEIKKNISLDAIALLGDFVRGDDTDTAENCNNMLVEIRRAFYKATENTPSIWTPGNHDNAHYYTRDDETDRTDGDAMYSYLGSNNQGMVIDPDNRHRIYGYRDFDSQKIRAIYLNTADVSDNSTTSSCHVSDSQLTWLTYSGLNFSDKDNANEWGVVFFSHHPLEWSETHTEPVINVINNYINRTGNFANKAGYAEIIAAFHGHTHNFITNMIGDSGFPSIGIPQVCFGRYNEYASDDEMKELFGEFMEDGVTPLYHYKALNSAQETSFNVIVIDRKLRKIYCTNYGAGKDREYNFANIIEPSLPTIIVPVIEVGHISAIDGSIDNDSTETIRTRDYIECGEGSTYAFTTGDHWWCLLFYDENKNFLTNWRDGTKSYKYVHDEEYVVPTGAKYMKLFCEDTGDTSNTITIELVS